MNNEVYNLVLDDLIKSCNREIEKNQLLLKEANGPYTRGLYQGKIESYQYMIKELVKKKSSLG